MRIVDQRVGPYERVVWATDDAAGLQAVVAVHSTLLGPAVGGCRFFPYPDQATALLDCLRLAEGMTLKSTAAGLNIGGGKAVIIGDPARTKTPYLLETFATVLNRLDGMYFTAEDVGTTTADMDALRQHTPYALGISRDAGGAGDPSPYTARGVVASMVAAWQLLTGHSDLGGCRVAVQGTGKVGADVARLCARQGAEVTVADIDQDRASLLAAEIGGQVVDPEQILVTPCDILSPCAMGGVLSPLSVPRLSCRLVCGAANNMLSSDQAADLLAQRGIDYVPDFIANAGGIIAIADEMTGFDPGRAMARAEGIGGIARHVVQTARAEGRSTLDVAEAMAARRLAAAAS